MFKDRSVIFWNGFTNSNVLVFYTFKYNQHSVLWSKIYAAEFGRNKKPIPKRMDKLLLRMAAVEVQDRPPGFLKWLYFRTVAACDMNKWKRHLRLISCHTGLPSQTEHVLRWEREQGKELLCEKHVNVEYLWSMVCLIYKLLHFTYQILE